jgi:hypothetical protein
MIPIETIPGMGEGRIKENGGGGEFKYDIFAIFKKFCKCHNVPPLSPAIKNYKK